MKANKPHSENNMKKLDEAFYIGMIVAIEHLTCHGEDTIVDELIDMVNAKILQTVAAKEPEANRGTLAAIARRDTPPGESSGDMCEGLEEK